MRKIVGVVLVLLGIVGLVYGGIDYTRRRTVLEIGTFKATAVEHETLPIPPIVGGIAVVAGLIVLVAPERRPPA